MSEQTQLSTALVSDAVKRIGEHDHCQAGGTIGLSGALAAALGQAAANATRSQQPVDAQDAAAKSMQQTMKRIQQEFLRLANADAEAILEFVALEERGNRWQAIHCYAKDRAPWPTLPLRPRRPCKAFGRTSANAAATTSNSP